jgi:hypothetical protein
MSSVRSDPSNDPLPPLPPTVDGNDIASVAVPTSPPLPAQPRQSAAPPVPPPLPEEIQSPASPIREGELPATGLPSVRTYTDQADPVVLPPRWEDPPPSPPNNIGKVKIVDREPEAGDDRLKSTVKASPPWLISCIVHALIVVILGLIPLLVMPHETLEFVASITDEMGEQTELESFTSADLLDPEVFVPPTIDELFVEDPQPMLSPVVKLPDLELGISEVGAPQMGQLLSGREAGTKRALLAAYGGSEKTESSVLAGLRWLQRRQDKSGLWSLSGRSGRRGMNNDANYAGGGMEENKAAATAMAMLAFQGYGQTHLGGPRIEFRRIMARAKTALLKMQSKRGDFLRVNRGDPSLDDNHRFYTQAMCTFALCELFAMSGDSDLRKPAQEAVDFLVKNQDTDGGWRYGRQSGFRPRSDLSVTGWVMMALQSARMADLKVPDRTLYRVEQFLDLVSQQEGSIYSYTAAREWSLSMTAEGLLCRQYLGWKQDHPAMLDGAEVLLDSVIDDANQNVYYWYYATQTLHNLEGKFWKQWNEVMSEYLPDKQVVDGREQGSWSPDKDAYGDAGGRLYTTCLSIYMLEVYYRHLPIYTLNLNLAVKKPEQEDKARRTKDDDEQASRD